MYYDYLAIYNPFDEDFELTVSSPILNTGDKYVIKSKGIRIFPEPVARNAASTISREVLRRAGKEFNDPSRLKIEEDLLSHKYQITEIVKETKEPKEEVPKSKK